MTLHALAMMRSSMATTTGGGIRSATIIRGTAPGAAPILVEDVHVQRIVHRAATAPEDTTRSTITDSVHSQGRLHSATILGWIHASVTVHPSVAASDAAVAVEVADSEEVALDVAVAEDASPSTDDDALMASDL